MGKVVNMADWRNRLPRIVTDREVVVKEITRLLQASIDQNALVYRGRTVIERETAAVKSLDYLMQAHRYAESKGFKIDRTEEEGGGVTYRIVG